jgi:hypothetical protein
VTAVVVIESGFSCMTWDAVEQDRIIERATRHNIGMDPGGLCRLKDQDHPMKHAWTRAIIFIKINIIFFIYILMESALSMLAAIAAEHHRPLSDRLYQ